jgi:hypothetical protein
MLEVLEPTQDPGWGLSHAECANEFASAAVKPSNTDYRPMESGSGERKEGIPIDLTFARHCTGRTSR